MAEVPKPRKNGSADPSRKRERKLCQLEGQLCPVTPTSTTSGDTTARPTRPGTDFCRDLIPTKTVAARLGITPRGVLNMADRMHIKACLDGGNSKFWSMPQVRAMISRGRKGLKPITQP